VATGRAPTAPAGSTDVVIKVPIGTQVFDDDQETLLADLDGPARG